MGDSQELHKGLGNIPSGAKASPHVPGHSEEHEEGIRSLLAAGVEG